MTHASRLHAGCGRAHEHERFGETGAARPFALSPGQKKQFERDRPFRVKHIALDLALSFEKKSITATATLDVTRVSTDATTIDLDAVAFDLTAVELDEKRAQYTYDGRILTVTIGRKNSAKIRIAYSATPRKGLYFLEPDAEVPTRPRQMWSQCQEEDARHFVPCHDAPHEKMTTEISVLVPRGFYALSNGELVSRRLEKGNKERFHWKMNEPHPSYLLTIAVGEFDEIEDKAGNIPLSYLVPKGREKDGRRTFKNTKVMIEKFGELIGQPYPWNRYAQVVVSDFIFGGMENTTATTLYEHVLIDERAAIDVSSEDLIAHELAHQWFGDFLTCRDWSEGWLNEGFATYFEQIWKEHKDGRDAYEYGIQSDLENYLAEAAGRYKRPIVSRDYESPLDLFDRHLYEKGGLVLHVLRQELGDATFFAGLKQYVAAHKKSIVETRDLVQALEDVSGRSLGQMFNELVYTAGHPDLEVTVAHSDGILTVGTKQTQEAKDGVLAAFHVTLELDLFDEKGKSERRVVTLDERAATFTLPCPKRPTFVVIDPRMRILGDVHGTAPNDMVRSALEKAPTARGRWRAAQMLAKSNDLLSIRALAKSLMTEKEAWMVRVEAAAALAAIRSDETEDALLKAVSVKHPKVRRAVVSALGARKSTRAAKDLARLAKSDPSYLVTAEAARALGRTRDESAKKTILAVIDEPSWADVISAAAVDGLGALKDDAVIPELLARTKYGVPTRVRRAAIWALAQLTADAKVREAIEDLLLDKDPHLRIDVVRALVEIGDVRSRRKLAAALEQDLDARVRRRIREGMRDLGRDEKKVGRELETRLEKMERDQAELRGEVQRLTAKRPKKR